MKELSVVEMNAVSGAGWGLWAGAGVGFMSGVLSGFLICKMRGESHIPKNEEQAELNRMIVSASTVLGALSGAIAEARS